MSLTNMGEGNAAQDNSGSPTTERDNSVVNKQIEYIIAETVADELDCDVLELPERLYDTVDVIALENLFSCDLIGGSVSFAYCGCTVTVHHDKSVSVTETEEQNISPQQ
ncbi:HalOD1 output domain-containing protein [Halobium palmae]|uniref:HalOD1 output domain-containing protein n=1 Tax=Halobium palmae TaxID=1776492 RepID=A0ABD5RV01_9EURY